VLRHVEFFRLSEKRVLLIIVASDGEVQNRVLVTDRSYSPAQLTEAANYANQHYAGVEFDHLRQRVRSELVDLHRDISTLMQAAIEAGTEAMKASDAMVISGERNLLEVNDIASDMERLRRLFDLFERKTSLSRSSTSRCAARACRSSSAASPAWPRPTTSAWSPRPTRWTAKWSAPSA
jgi:heat-inducible transcriptional repressor